MIADLLTQYCRNLSLKSNEPVTSNESSTLKVEVWDQQVQRFELDYESIPVTGLAEQRKFFALLNSVANGKASFEWQLPLFFDPIGVADVNPNLLVDASAGSKQIQLNHVTSSDPILVTGDIFKFSNHPKVYMAMSDVVGTNPTIDLNTPLVVDVTTSDTVITSNVTMTLIMRPSDEPIEYKRQAGDFDAQYVAKFVEKV